MAASLLLAQRDYKRMLAYHSIEHMGLIALGAAAGSPLAIAAVLLHILGHGLAKSVLFLQRRADPARHRAPAGSKPCAAWPAGAGARRHLRRSAWWPCSAFRRSACSPASWACSAPGSPSGWAGRSPLALASMAGRSSPRSPRHAGHMLLGSRDQPRHRDRDRGTAAASSTAAAALIAGLGVCAVLGMSAWPLQALLHAAALVAGGTLT